MLFRSFEYALYLGYENNIKTFVKTIYLNNWNFFSEPEKSVFQCFIVERSNIILNRLIVPIQNEENKLGIFTVKKDETIILTEVTSVDNNLKRYSIYAFVYDGTTESCDLIRREYIKLPMEIPRVLINIANDSSFSSLEALIKELDLNYIPSSQISLNNPKALMKFISNSIRNQYV